MEATLNMSVVSLSRSTLTPAASTVAHSPAATAWRAEWTLTSDEEHAVSVLMAGPLNPNVYEMRPDATLSALPVALKTDAPGAYMLITWGCSMELMPTKTPTSERGHD
jgi:hypothetical protein